MIIVKKRFVTKVVEEVEDVILMCNSCEKSVSSSNGSRIDENNMHQFEVSGGFGTTYPQDLERANFVLCSTCLKDVVGKFKISPEITNYDIGD